jgi:pimeloyl-ACP methyl ester carboxylesterase
MREATPYDDRGLYPHRRTNNMHDRSAPKLRNRRRSQAPARHQIVAQRDVGAAPPSARFNPRSFGPTLWGLALVGTLAACASGPSVADENSISTAATPAPGGTPTTVATPNTLGTPTSAAVPATEAARTPVGAATVSARSTVVDEFAIVDGTRMHIRCVGSGATTVVLIGGFNDGGDSWGTIEAPLADDARVCSAARFGTGTSDPPPAVQTFTSQATQLGAALESVGEPGPYVLTGHSFGGAEAVAFASMFPDRVSALVLIDASPTDWPEAACAVTDDGSDVARIFHDNCTIDFRPDGNPERLDVRGAFAEVATITSLGSLPIVVVTADTKPYPGLEAGEAARLNDVWHDGQLRWAALSSVGHVVSVANTSHYIHLDQPTVVIEHIKELSR